MSSYAPLQLSSKYQGENDDAEVAVTNASRRYFLLFFLLAMASFIFGIDVGRQLSSRYAVDKQHGSSDLLSDLGGVRKAFEYERIYAGAPNNDSNTAWKEIFPTRGGFFMHPQLAPDGSGLAVFHQLHCLDNIRRGYWSNADDGPHISPAHIRHCIDYLRQSLMCHADTNIEPIDQTLNGVRGFGVEHKCRDFSAVRDWISRWEDGIANVNK